jgi:type IV pilus assembly protein PilE
MPMQSGSRKHQSLGFTLIELMVTLAIVSILATIAVTSYSSQVLKSRRAEAKTALLDLAGREERLFSTTNAYSSDASFLGYATASTPMTNINFGNRYYQLTATVPALSPNTYVLTANPVGSQANDTTCGSLAVNQLGVETVTGTGTVATCWGN